MALAWTEATNRLIPFFKLARVAGSSPRCQQGSRIVNWCLAASYEALACSHASTQRSEDIFLVSVETR